MFNHLCLWVARNNMFSILCLRCKVWKLYISRTPQDCLDSAPAPNRTPGFNSTTWYRYSKSRDQSLIYPKGASILTTQHISSSTSLTIISVTERSVKNDWWFVAKWRLGPWTKAFGRYGTLSVTPNWQALRIFCIRYAHSLSHKFAAIVRTHCLDLVNALAASMIHERKISVSWWG